jgi:hypothetical protein
MLEESCIADRSKSENVKPMQEDAGITILCIVLF